MKESYNLTAKQVAKRLYNLSIDYIAGLTNEKQGLTKSSSNNTETQLIKKFRQLNDINRGQILERIDILLKEK
ncbi:MAG: hypothetical protein ACI4I6_10975 [Hominimerdicola sp.]